MSQRARIAVGLIVGGISIALAGELLGVFGPGDDPDTITDYVIIAAENTYGLALIPVLGLLAWAAYHFVDSYRSRRS